MQFIDEAKIYLKAGDGGPGAVSFHREKFIERGGPDGGNGGSGGSIILRSNPHMNTLLNFRYTRHFKAENGEYGKGRNMTGKSRPSLILEVPVGTQIFSEDGNLLIYDFDRPDDEFEILKGGKGGLGNAHFKSSTNRSPRKRTSGEIGEEMEIVMKLKLLSDVGLVGLPNVGKSTLLSVATSAKPKIADYHFTTLKPMLGVVYVSDEEFVLADIPGLIKNAHLGSGLGDRFLQHIERCGVIIHVIDATHTDIIEDYDTIRDELSSYSELLKQKQEIVCLSKIDSIDTNELQDKIKQLKQHTGKEVYPISNFTKEGLKPLLNKVLEYVMQEDEEE